MEVALLPLRPLLRLDRRGLSVWAYYGDMYGGDKGGGGSASERDVRFVTGIGSSFHVVVRLTFDDLTANSIVPSFKIPQKMTISMLKRL